MTAMYNRTYENSYEDIANGLPLKRSPEVEKDSAYSNLPASYRKVMALTTICTADMFYF